MGSRFLAAMPGWLVLSAVRGEGLRRGLGGWVGAVGGIWIRVPLRHPRGIK